MKFSIVNQIFILAIICLSSLPDHITSNSTTNVLRQESNGREGIVELEQGEKLHHQKENVSNPGVPRKIKEPTPLNKKLKNPLNYGDYIHENETGNNSTSTNSSESNGEKTPSTRSPTSKIPNGTHKGNTTTPNPTTPNITTAENTFITQTTIPWIPIPISTTPEPYPKPTKAQPTRHPSTKTPRTAHTQKTDKTTKKPLEWSISTVCPDDPDNNLGTMNISLDNDINLDSPGLVRISSELNKFLNKKKLQRNTSLITTMMIMDKIDKHIKSITKDEVSNFTDNMVENCNDVLDHNQAWQNINDTNKKVEMSSKILEVIMKTGFSFGCNKNTTKLTRIIKSNIVIETYSIDSKKGRFIKLNQSGSGIVLPPGMPDLIPDTGCDAGTAVGAVVTKLSDYLSASLAKDMKINSNIVGFSVENSLNSTQLPKGTPPVKIVLKHKEPLEWGDRVNCVYWDFNHRNWSTNGCRFIEIKSNRRLSVCECNHLTNFAALMDVSGRETDTKVKDILTKVCCGLSIVCFILTISFLTLFRSLRNRRNAITSNLCFCLLIVNLLVVFGMDSTQNNTLCQSIAICLLYFILCSFSWMVMEGYHLYQMIVLVFANVGHLRRIYLYGIGYGVPLIITIIDVLSIGFKNLMRTDSYFCWISSVTYPYRVWAVAGPASAAIFINSLFLILALKAAYSAKVRKNQIYQVDAHDTTIKIITEKLSQAFTRIRGFVSLFLLLGIPWICFILYINRFGQSFSYVFIVVNGLQGVSIFVFQILLNEKSRSVLRKAYLKNISSHSLFTNSKNSSTTDSQRSHTTNDSDRH